MKIQEENKNEKDLENEVIIDYDIEDNSSYLRESLDEDEGLSRL